MWAGGWGRPQREACGGLPCPRGYLSVHPDVCRRKCACAHVGLRVHVGGVYMCAIQTHTCMRTRV